MILETLYVKMNENRRARVHHRGHFRGVAHDVGFRSRQAKVNDLSKLYPQWDKKLRRWDAGIAHFGLGKLDRKTVDKITIRWPGDSENTTIRNVRIRQTIVVRRRANKEAYDADVALHQGRSCSVKLQSTSIVEAPEHGRVDMNGSILSKSEIRYTSNSNDSLSDKFKVISTF